MSTQKALRNFFIAMFVFGFQVIVTTEGLFECPIKGNDVYGCMFIFAPALVLFLISLVMNDSIKSVTWSCRERMFRVFCYSFTASCLWISCALLQKDYYTCAVVGSKEQLKNVTGQEKKDLEERFENAAKASQIYGFSILAVMLGIPLLFLTVRNCCYHRLLSFISSRLQYEKLVKSNKPP